MALKGDRNYNDGVDISFFMNHVCERGGIVVHNRNLTASGAAMDQANAQALGTGTTPSGTKPLGLLLNDVVNLDLTRQHLNQHQDEVQIGSKVAILRRGTVVTNVISGTQLPTGGDPAYYGSAVHNSVSNMFVLTTSKVSDNNPAGGGVVIQGTGVGVDHLYRVGTFLSSKDSDGYAKVEINIG